jgi:glucose/mannose transport system permease protein
MGALKSQALADVAGKPRHGGAHAGAGSSSSNEAVAAARQRRPLRPLRKRFPLAAWIALLPMLLTVVFAYLGTMVWTARVSFSNSRTFPSNDFVGFTQYVRLFHNDRWLVSLQHIVLYGACFIVACIVIGMLLAIFIDQRVSAEGVLRTIFLYPYAMSFVATGLVWQWILNPSLGAQAVLRKIGFAHAHFDWIVDQDFVVYTLVIATVWQASGLVMALMLAGLRGVDDELWKAARLDGIPRWRVYLSIVIPMLGPSLSTAFVLLFVMVVKLYDAVVAMTQGGPGTASEVPAKFIMDYLFGRANIGLASAASVVMLLTVLAILAPFFYARSRAAARKDV